MRLRMIGIIDFLEVKESLHNGDEYISASFILKSDDDYYKLSFNLILNGSHKPELYVRKNYFLNNNFEKIESIEKISRPAKSKNYVDLHVLKESGKYRVPSTIRCEYFYYDISQDNPLHINFEKFKIKRESKREIEN